jgi:hypothetical protein
VLGQAEEAREEPAQDLGRLGRRPHRHLGEVSVPAGGDRPRFERHARPTVQREPLAHRHPGPGQGARRIAHPLREAGRDVPRAVHARPIGPERVLQRGDRGERRILDPDRGDGVLGLGRALGHDEGDRLPHVGDDLLREDLRAGGGQQARMRDEERQPPEHRHVGGNEHVHDAGAPARRPGVDRYEPRVRMRAPMDGNVEHPGKRHVGHVPAAAGDQPRVLAAAHVRPEEPLAHVSSPMGARATIPDLATGGGRGVATLPAASGTAEEPSIRASDAAPAYLGGFARFVWLVCPLP